MAEKEPHHLAAERLFSTAAGEASWMQLMRTIIFVTVVLCCGWVQADELVFSIGQQLSPYTIPGTDPAHFAYLRTGGGDSYTKISTSDNAFVGWGFELVPIEGDIRYYITEQRWDASSSPEAAALLASISNKPSASMFVEGPTIESTNFHNPLDPNSCQSPPGVCITYSANDFVHTADTSGWAITSIDVRMDLTSRNRLVSWQFRFNGQPVPEPTASSLMLLAVSTFLVRRR